jgi:hypothetical protein
MFMKELYHVEEEEKKEEEEEDDMNDLSHL